MTVAEEIDPLFGHADPHDIEAEQSVLGALLVGALRHVDEVQAVIKPGDFYRPQHEVIYRAILDLSREGQRADTVTVKARLGRDGTLGEAGGAPYLHTLMAAVPIADSAASYARIVKGMAKLRLILRTGSRLMQYGHTGDPDDADALIGQALTDLTELDPGDRTAPTQDQIYYDTLDWLENGDSSELVPLPYIDLNGILGGLRPGQLVVIGARPAIGKSTVAMDVARHAALRHGLPVYYATLEMSEREVGLRMISAEGKINLTRLMNRDLNEADWDKFRAIQPRIAGNPLMVVDDEPNVTVDRLRAELRKMTRRETGPARLVVVDYIQLMQPTPGKRRQENRQVEISEISRSLKVLAKEFKVPVVALSQLNRGVEMRSDKRPIISDLRESGAIEQDADVVVLLHRDDDPETGRPGEMELNVGKNRNGPTGSVSVSFQGHYSRAMDMAR